MFLDRLLPKTNLPFPVAELPDVYMYVPNVVYCKNYIAATILSTNSIACGCFLLWMVSIYQQ